MSQYLTRGSFLMLLLLLLWCPGSALADGFTLTAKAPPRRIFAEIKVTWTNAKKDPVGQARPGGGGVAEITFNTNEEEDRLGLARGTIHDWKQYTKVTKLDGTDATESTAEAVFAKKGSPFEILSYSEAYSLLGLRAGEDFLFLPDFCADLDNDGFAETHLFSAINLFDLALNFPQFINNQPFVFGQSYTATDFTQFGFVFSVSDNIQFDPELGYITNTPYSPSGIIIANSLHSTGAVPEPTTMLLLGTGLAGVAIKMRRRFKRGKNGQGSQ